MPRACSWRRRPGSPRTPSVHHRRSVFHAHADHDEHRIVLLRAALDWRHCSPWCNWKRRLTCVGWRARTTNRRRCIARGATGQVRHVVERRAFIEIPAPVAILISGMNGQHRCHVAGAPSTSCDVPEAIALEPIEHDRDCYGVPCSSFVLRPASVFSIWLFSPLQAGGRPMVARGESANPGAPLSPYVRSPKGGTPGGPRPRVLAQSFHPWLIVRVSSCFHHQNFSVHMAPQRLPPSSARTPSCAGERRATDAPTMTGWIGLS